jgi:hypothetical protein
MRNQQLSIAFGNRLGQNTWALANVTVPAPLSVVVVVVMVLVSVEDAA